MKREESNDSFARSMLHEISKTGSKTNETFEKSIDNLNDTIISSLLNDVSFLAKLSIDIMDRNLYERANDCRWWALTSFFRNSQNYSVSSFEKTPLYNGDSTYIYGASITDVERGQNVLGGIGVVFDARPEFYEMLNDTLPKKSDGSTKEGYIALYCDKDKKVISSTNQRFKIGEMLCLDDKFFHIEVGSSYSDIIEYEGQYYAIGSSLSHGYREYKVHDNYLNNVFAIILVDLGDATNSDKKVEAPQHHSFKPAYLISYC